MAKKPTKKKTVVQRHHLVYPSDGIKERVVYVYKGEHHCLTMLGWRKNVSKGCLEALRKYIKDTRGIAVNLRREYERKH